MNTNKFRANYHSKSQNLPRFIYCLADPRDSRIRYIGVSYEPEQRLKRQLYEARVKRNWKGYIERPDQLPPRLQWLNSLADIDETPTLAIIEKCEYRDWRERENHWIVKLYNAGASLTNVRTTAGYDNIKHENYHPIRE